MARIRTIKPEFWCDEKLSVLSAIDRLTFLGLISMADDFGRVHDNVKVIDAFVFPNSEDSVRESLANLSRIIRIRRGNSSSGMPIIEIVNWTRHQKVDKPQPKLALPEICEKAKENKGKDSIRESLANDSRIARELVAPLTTDLHTTDQGAGAESKPPSPPSEENSKSPKKPPNEWQLPKSLDTPRIRELLSRFEAMRLAMKKPIRDRANTSLGFRHFDDEEHLAYALEHCIANEYQGLKPDYRPSQTTQSKKKKDNRPNLSELLAKGDQRCLK